ncbi:MAG: Ppx/GppA family phosphatase [Hyphomonadaceae bacterium]|nr:Ppx/GppA family phosphatase [Hyphomonadaceae bacterium]
MADKDGAERPGRKRAAPYHGAPTGDVVYAALDLGTNNCRLLLAEPTQRGFRVLESYSRIIRLGEGLTASGVLSDTAMGRAMEALMECARIVAPHQQLRIRCIATQACRIAANGTEFLTRVKRETGLTLEIVTPAEEARLSVLGCAPLMDPSADVALVIDIGGGSTELSWVDPRSMHAKPRVLAWTSLPVGVVTLAEQFPEPDMPDPNWYAAMSAAAADHVRAFAGADQFKNAFHIGRAHMVGTSGAVSSLAGVHLELPKYQRSRVDGLWMQMYDVRKVSGQLRSVTRESRAAHPCIGADRADLVVPGSAILEAVSQLWPVERVRVADRGLREGVLLELIAASRASAS